MTSVSGADAVILVGGKGTRLRPLTLSAPKPMLPTAGVPFLSHMLSRIRAAGITHVVLGTSYRAEVFERYFGDGSALGLDIEYVVESEPLDTGGAIRNVADHLRADDAVIFNGDILSGADLAALVAAHRTSRADVTLHLQRVDDPSRFGSVPTADDGRVTAFLEKTPNPPTDQINAGCYVFRRSVIEEIPAGRRVSVERETFPGLLERGRHVHGFVDDSYWLDVGTPEAFVRGSADLVTGIAPSAALPGPAGQRLVLDGAVVAGDAEVTGGSTVGAGARVASGARVRGSVLFDGAEVAEGAVVEHSVLGAGARVGKDAVLRGVVLGDRAVVGAGCELLDGARVWPEIELPDSAIRFSSDA
ncbi:sugar phosphate nucleotidyltransferase [Saccharomonospora xinjiangensis]|uniref:Nucleoside-diphosphate-sugar pyrophosphorylase family protein n=1 Tax=Saccharomonospora xinjiangensis XJ-54 TaxID=882086 RepID=I0V0H6_9PSEU|nr:NDP-sugar synthase [Saccharomonospora xinjiangensis]EID53629.1 Nucleoside-diphosphate-sugar pyrophosphorylase family protein [Saccharomonospora xinjiangensis XJ-54]